MIPADSWLCERPLISCLDEVRVGVCCKALSLVSSWLTVMENSWCLSGTSSAVLEHPSRCMELLVLIRLLCLDVGEEVQEEEEEGFNLDTKLLRVV